METLREEVKVEMIIEQAVERATIGGGGVEEGQREEREREGREEEDAVEKIQASGQPEEIVGLMKHHIGAAEVQEEGCVALYHLGESASNVKWMKALGTVREVVESAITAHPSNAFLQQYGKDVLAQLAR